MRRWAVALCCLVLVSTVKESEAEENGGLGNVVAWAVFGLVIAVASEGIPDVGVTTDGELALAWEPVYYVSRDASIGLGITTFPGSDRANRYFGEGRYELFRSTLNGNVGGGAFIDGDGTFGPRVSFGVYWGETVALGGGIELLYDIANNSPSATIQSKLEIRWR